MMPLSYVVASWYATLLPLFLLIAALYLLVVVGEHLAQGVARLIKLWWKNRSSERPWGGWPR